MNKYAFFIITACALVAGCRTSPDSTTWEYKVATLHVRRSLTPDANSEGSPEAVREAQERLLNDMGREGWVLVSQNDGRIFYFKRPVKSPKTSSSTIAPAATNSTAPLSMDWNLNGDRSTGKH